MLSRASSRLAAMDERGRGVAHHYTTEQLLAFSEVSAADKLRWLEEVSHFLARFQSDDQRETMQRFRRGDL